MKKLKCWKKVTDTQKLVEFEHICNHYNGGLVQVHRNDSFLPPWRTSLHFDRKFVKDDLSTTKTKALSVAETFMEGYVC